MKERKGRYHKLKKQMEARRESRISLTDPDSQPIPKNPKVDMAYNVQTAVDDKHKLIVEQDVTNAVIYFYQMSGIAIKAKETLGVDHMKVVADMGYYPGDEIKACEEAAIEPYVSKPLTSANRKLGLYVKEKFRYDPLRDAINPSQNIPCGKNLFSQCGILKIWRQFSHRLLLCLTILLSDRNGVKNGLS